MASRNLLETKMEDGAIIERPRKRIDVIAGLGTVEISGVAWKKYVAIAV